MNPRTWVPKASTLTSRPPKPLIRQNKLLNYLLNIIFENRYLFNQRVTRDSLVHYSHFPTTKTPKLIFQNTNLVHNSLIFNNIYVILHSSTCFEQHAAHHQEDQLYHHSLWYRHRVRAAWAGSAPCRSNSFTPRTAA